MLLQACLEDTGPASQGQKAFTGFHAYEHAPMVEEFELEKAATLVVKRFGESTSNIVSAQEVLNSVSSHCFTVPVWQHCIACVH